jgi:amino acid transporter
MWLCGLASITSMARMWYAFARDDGMPGSSLVKQVNPTYRTSVWSILITSALAVVLCLYAAAYYVVTFDQHHHVVPGVHVPDVSLNWRNRRRGQGEHATPATAPWSLGRWGPLLNVVAIAWVLFLTVIFSLPPNELVLWTMLALTLGLVLYWQMPAKRSFVGPTRADEQALRRLESAVEETASTAAATR